MKYLYIVPLMALLECSAYGASYCDADLISYNTSIENCASGETYRFGSKTVESCQDCSVGVPFIYQQISDSACTNKFIQYRCPATCSVQRICDWMDYDCPILDSDLPKDCQEWEYIQFGQQKYTVCVACTGGRTPVYEQLSSTQCTNTTTIVAKCTIDEPCETSADCSTKILTDYGDGSAYLEYQYCYNGGCASDIIDDGCMHGYFGSLRDCTKCPTDDSQNTASSALGEYEVSRCFMPAGTRASDETGEFIYSSDCYYRE